MSKLARKNKKQNKQRKKPTQTHSVLGRLSFEGGIINERLIKRTVYASNEMLNTVLHDNYSLAKPKNKLRN